MYHSSITSTNKWIASLIMFGFLTLMHHYVVRPTYKAGHAVVHVMKKVIV